MPPFEPGQFVCELASCRLLKNKFAFDRNHLLLTTKEFRSQEEPLS